MSTVDSEDLAGLAVASRGVRRQRASRALLTKMLRDRAETDDPEESETTGGGEEDEGRIVKALIGSRMLRKRRVRNLLLTHLIRERAESGEEEGDEFDEDTGG